MRSVLLHCFTALQQGRPSGSDEGPKMCPAEAPSRPFTMFTSETSACKLTAYTQDWPSVKVLAAGEIVMISSS